MNKKNVSITAGAVVIIIVLIFLAKTFIGTQKDTWICNNGAWVRQGSPKTSQPKTPCAGKRIGPKLPSSPPESTVVKIYEEILSRSENDIDLYKNSPYLTSKLKKQIADLAKTGQVNSDSPLTCSENKIKKYTITNHNLNNMEAIVNITLEFDSKNKEIAVHLDAVNNEWKISKIDCT